MAGVESLRSRLDWRPQDALLSGGEAVVVALLDALWSCVVGNRKNEARFLAQDGVVRLRGPECCCVPLCRLASRTLLPTVQVLLCHCAAVPLWFAAY